MVREKPFVEKQKVIVTNDASGRGTIFVSSLTFMSENCFSNEARVLIFYFSKVRIKLSGFNNGIKNCVS